MALTTGLATSVSAAAGPSAPSITRAVTAAATAGTPTGAPSTAPKASALPETPGVDGKTLAAAQAALQRASLLTDDSLTISAKQAAKIEEQAAAVRALIASREDGGAASRSGERAPLATTAAKPGTDLSADLSSATEDLRALLDKTAASAVDIEAAPPTPAELIAQQKQAAKAAAASLAAHTRDTAGYANGRIPAAALCELPFAPGQALRCDAAEQLERLDAAYKVRFGEHLEIVDSYRSYESQVATRATRGYLAAVPGYSNHGWGVAIDLGDGVQSFGTARYEWLRDNAPAFGWDNPDWARPGGSKPEAWHWEYTPLGS